MLIPISGKPGELDLSLIKTPGDADRVLLWLCSVLKDMKQQITDRGDDVDAEWLRRLRAAQRATTNVYHRALEKRDSLNGERSVSEAILAAVIDQNDDELMARLHRWVSENTPHLAGVDLAAAKHLLV